MTFSRQHYVATAMALRTQKTRSETVAAMADMFAADNPRFDRARFETACGETPSGGAAATPFSNINTGQWNAMVMQPDGVAKEVLNVSLLSHANGVFNHTVGLLTRMGLLFEGHDCTYEEFEAAFSKLVSATAYYKQDNGCSNCGQVHGGGLLACGRAIKTAIEKSAVDGPPVPTAGGEQPCGHCVEQTEMETGKSGPAWECDHCEQPSSMSCIDNTPDGLTGCNKCGCVFGRDGLTQRARTCERTPRLLANAGGQA